MASKKTTKSKSSVNKAKGRKKQKVHAAALPQEALPATMPESAVDNSAAMGEPQTAAAAAETTPVQPTTPGTTLTTSAELPAEPKKLSAIDAAVKVLGESGQAMNCQELIAAMAAKGYWASPSGKTPASTLYASILRELKVRGAQARFQKTDRGKFALHLPA